MKGTSLTLYAFLVLMAASLSVSCLGCGMFDRETEISDPYLVQLFTPDFPCKSVKEVEDDKGRRFIVIKAEHKLNKQEVNKYNDLLISRGVNIFGSFYYGYFSWQKSLTDFVITITRKVENEPDTIEISQSVAKDPVKNEPIMAISVRWNEIRIAIENDFGKKWEKIKIMPEEEPNVPDIKIGRYPGSKLGKIDRLPSGRKVYHYAAKASLLDVALYLHKQMKSRYFMVHPDFGVIANNFSNPHYRTDIRPFGIKCMGKYADIRGGPLDVKLSQGLDPKLSPYVEIYIQED